MASWFDADGDEEPAIDADTTNEEEGSSKLSSLWSSLPNEWQTGGVDEQESRGPVTL